MVTPPARLKPDEIAAPVDIRLVPAAILTAAMCLLLPALPPQWSTGVVTLLVAVGLVTLALTVLLRRANRRAGVWIMLALACWGALPATLTAQADHRAAVTSGWHDFTTALGTAKLSVRLDTDPIHRDAAFGGSWYVTAQVQYFGRDQAPTPHPAKIIIAADASWQHLRAPQQACFFGRVTESESTVFVTALAPVSLGACGQGPGPHETTGRDLIRAALREHSATTPGSAPQLLPGLVLGDRSQQTEALDEAMKVSGLSHLSAVSGAHTSLVAAAAIVVLRSLRLPRAVVLYAFLGTLVLFVYVVGYQPSILRAATMGAIGAWAVFFGRGSQALPVLACSMIVMLSFAPELMGDVGFQLSVATTAGIVLAAQPLERWCTPWVGKLLPDFWARLVSSSLAMAIAAQLACQPLLLTFVDYVSPYSVVANLLATPLLPFITVPGTVAAGLGVVAPPVGQLLVQLVGIPAAAIGWIATTVAGLPYAKLPWPSGPLGLALIVLYWGASAILVSKLLRWQRTARPTVNVLTPRPIWDRLVTFLGTTWSPKTMLEGLVVLLAVVAHVAVLWPHTGSRMDPSWDLIGCDVGQGDMFLIRTGVDSAMVMDTGPDPNLSRACLRTAGIVHIDVLFLTHLHADHIGGLAGILEVAQPAQVLYSTAQDTVGLPAALHQVAGAQRVVEPISGDVVHSRDEAQHPVQVRWSILAAEAHAADENSASLVVLVEVMRHGGLITALFTGDLEADTASQLIAQGRIPEAVDVLKLAHHGARNGGTAMIEHTTPRIAMLGVGHQNPYGHPHADIIAALGPRTRVYRTDQDGTFGVTFAPKAVTLVAAG